MEKHESILWAEEQFAREVTLGVIIQRPLSVFHYLIPGMFIFNYLRRGSAIREYTKHFLFSRKLAMNAARDLIKGEERGLLDPQITAEVANWLKTLNLYSEDLAKAQKAVVDLLVEHFRKLLEADGVTYYDLIENTYKTRNDFVCYLDKLSAAEKIVDQAIIKKAGPSKKLKEKLKAEEQQVDMRRKKIVEEIF
ncbi:MAG: NF038143 family protein [Desulfobacterales bacterium]